MALTKSARIKRNRRWLVIDGDASSGTSRQTLGSYKTEKEAIKARSLFGYVRAESDDEVASRLGL